MTGGALSAQGGAQLLGHCRVAVDQVAELVWARLELGEPVRDPLHDSADVQEQRSSSRQRDGELTSCGLGGRASIAGNGQDVGDDVVGGHGEGCTGDWG